MNVTPDGAVETILAAYLTDGHFNGIAIGLRSLDPMVFKVLLDEGLIRTVFPVRGSGGTWSLGAYFSRELSIKVLANVEGGKKPKILILPDVLATLNTKGMMRWVLELEGSIYPLFWGSVPLVAMEVEQYEDVELGSTFWSAWKERERLRLSVRETRKLINENVIKPSRIWLDQIMTLASTDPLLKRFRIFKKYQLDALPKKKSASLSHRYLMYFACYDKEELLDALPKLMLSQSWKNLITRIYADIMKRYARGEVNKEEVRLIKTVVGCAKGHPMKGPYNEYVLYGLKQIAESIDGRAAKKLLNLRNYLTSVRKKSYRNLMEILTKSEKSELNALALRIDSVNELLALLCDNKNF